MEFKRPQFSQLLQRLAEPRRFIQVITGPRQVGKTTLAQQYLKEYSSAYHFVTADGVAADNQQWITQQWQIGRLMLQQQEASEYLLIIDEIQKINNWSETVKKLWDEDTRRATPIKVLLLGSAQLLIEQGLSESLMGRFEIISLPHWSYAEMREAFDFTAEQYVWFGAYPGAAALIKEEERWEQYIKNAFIETTISKDILQMTRVHKPALLKNLFELSCAYVGQVLSYTKMLGQLQDAGNTTTLSHYLDLLSIAGMVTGIENYSNLATRTRASSPKLQVLNTAFLPVYTKHNFTSIQLDTTAWGRHVEASIGAHLLNQTVGTNIKTYYWRQGNDEVDFVLEKHGELIGLEVKSARARSKKGMIRFDEKFTPKMTLLIGDNGLRWQDFLMLEPRSLFE